MGVDLLRVSISENISIDYRDQLIMKQQVNFPLDAMDTTLVDFIQQKTGEKERNLQAYREAKQQLQSICNLPQSIDHWSIDENDIRRVVWFTGNAIIPLEWRIEIYSTLPHEKLQVMLTKWRSYLDAIKDGKFRAYCCQLLLYENQQALTICSEDLQYALTTSHTLTNAWTQKDRFVEARAHIEKEGVPEFQTPLTLPNFENFLNIDSTFKLLDEQLREKDTLVHQVKLWNRNVNSHWKINYPSTLDLNEFIERYSKDESVFQFMTWCDDVVKNKQGLFLYY